MYIFGVYSPDVEGVSVAEVFEGFGSYIVAGRKGKVDIGGRAVTDREGSYTGECGLERW